jgi:hypothetical protein
MAYRIFKTWILLAFLAAAMCGLVYLAVQQSLRMGANDPQIQMAENVATALRASLMPGQKSPDIIPQGNVDIAQSLSPFIVIFDLNGNPLAGNGFLDDALPQLPPGVFVNTARAGEERFTWQPRPGVRIAVVLARIPNNTTIDGHPQTGNPTVPYFVLAGRSLREVEAREDQALFEAVAVWLATAAGIFILLLLFAAVERKGNRS